MKTVAESPTDFLEDLRKKIQVYYDLHGYQRATTSREIITKFEELDDWLSHGGDAPEQWVEAQLAERVT